MKPFNPVIPEAFMESLNPVPFYRHEHGQIKAESPFGIALAQCALLAENIVEIGTWHGEGSTVCIARGMVRPTQHLWSLETDADCVAHAREYHAKDPRIEIIHGAIVLILGQPESLWIPVERLPVFIDLLLIDGADEAGEKEFDLLWQRCRMIALDDTQKRKNSRNVDLLWSWNWKPLYSGHDRNGWAIYEKP